MRRAELRSFRMLPVLVAVGLVGTLAARPALAAPPSLAEILAKPVIDPQTPLAEVQDFCELRVPPMPEVRTPAEWEKHADRMRKDVLSEVVLRGAAAEWDKVPTRVEWFDAEPGGPGYRLRKLRFEAVPGMWIPAVLYEPEKLAGKVPVVLNVNGHDRKFGKASDFKQTRCINVAKRGMLALNLEWVGMGQLFDADFGHYGMNRLDLVGTSGLAPFWLSMRRALDILLEHEHADPARVAVAGLSGGGWQTIFVSALDPRVTLANPVAGYSGFRTRVRFLQDLGDSEQTPCDLALHTDYVQLTAMRAPRPTLLTYNADDKCCFKADHALPPLLAGAEPVFALYGKSANLRSHVNTDPGTHNFEKDNRQQFYRMLGDHFFPNSATFARDEIPCADEIRTPEQLSVPLPEKNAGFGTLATQLAATLPKRTLPEKADALAEWQRTGRRTLAALVKPHDYDVRSMVVGDDAFEGGRAVRHRLRMGGVWTVPAVELIPTEAKAGAAPAIVFGEAGRAKLAETIAPLLASGRTVWAVDPFFWGESKIASHDFLFALLAAACGERPLGLQASQVAALARWLSTGRKSPPAEIVAVGPRAGLVALVAGALEEKSVGGLVLHDPFGSLKQILEDGTTVDKAPELFCFGLLKEFDVVHLAALTAPRPARVASPSDRARRELAPLATVYRLAGSPHDPLGE